MKLALMVTVALAGSNVLGAHEVPTDQLERNKAVVSRHIERLNAGDVTGAVAAWAEADIRDHGASVPGREFVRAALEDLLATFPDWQVEVLSLVAEADTVATLCRVSGTHLGNGSLTARRWGLPAGLVTGNRMDGVYQIQVYKLRQGNIVDQYTVRDDVGIARQLGLKLFPGSPFTQPPR
jgi:predicted ester cyclase